MSESSLWKEPVVAQLNNQVHLTENYLYLRGKRIRRAFVGAAENGFNVCQHAEITGAYYMVVRYPIFPFFYVLSLYLALDF